jgi:hypothetical protein
METSMRQPCRILLALTLPLLFASAMPALAQQAAAPPVTGPAAPEAEELGWQTVITHQIEAFRQGDALVALSFAAIPFHKQFDARPMAFMATIYNSGYGPIFLSRSHSFGQWQKLGDGSAMQVVRFVGPKQEVFDAIYQMIEEAEGWRVAGVMLSAPKGTEI